MPVMMIESEEASRPAFPGTSILLASDSERHGSTMHRALRQQGITNEYVGGYAEVEAVLRRRRFDLVLLEVTGEHAVEAAVATALQVKRLDSGQFVGYLADPHLEASGLAGDAVFPRNAVRLSEQLRDLGPARA